ncbi:MAG: putative quinol monooxygenase [Thermodesulfobacteriota bacterium]
MISVIAKLTLQHGKKQQAMEAIQELMAGVARESGTLHYTVNMDENYPDVLIFMERYRDMEALKAHGATPHFRAFMDKVPDFAEGQPEINVLTELASI